MHSLARVAHCARREGKVVRILFNPEGVVQKYFVLDIGVDLDKAGTPEATAN